MSYRIQMRRDTQVNWGANNPTLSQGEIGYETDTGRLKIGDGTSVWSSLSYFSGAQSTLPITGGGTGQTDAQSAIDALCQASSGTNEYVLTKDTATGHMLLKASQGGFFTNSGSLVYLTTTTNKLAIGNTALISTEKFLIDGSIDIIQAIIRANATQTANILEVRKSDNTVCFSVSNGAGAIVGGTSVSIGSNVANTPVSWTTAFIPKVITVSDGAGAVIDASLGNHFNWTMAADRTAGTTTNGVAGQKITIAITASGGARTLTLPTSTTGDFAFGSDITTISQTSSGKTDYIGCVYTGTRWNVVAFVKGY